MTPRLTTVSLLLVLFVFAVSAHSQTSGLEREMSDYTRFLVYPHLQQGQDAERRGDHARAISEFERARALAPASATVALNLADAYRASGDRARAARVLREQLARTPGDARVKAALASVSEAPSAAGASKSNTAASSVMPPVSTATSKDAPVAALPAAPVVVAPPPRTAARRAPGIAGRAAARLRASVPPPLVASPRTEFDEALRAGRADAAGRIGEAWLAAKDDPGLLDEVTYRLVEGGATTSALRALVRAYPFTTGAPVLRETLLQRLGGLIESLRNPGIAVGQEPLPTALAKLRLPLDTPALRGLQAAIWVGLGDCEAVRHILADHSDAYEYADWVRLGDCSVHGSPIEARLAYAHAHALRPGGDASRALAYQAYASGDDVVAMDAWRSVGEALAGDDLLAAVNTAVDANASAQALTWLDRYRATGGSLDRRYWTLAAAAHTAAEHPGDAIDAVEHLVTLQPTAETYVHLARLYEGETRRDQQVQALERAASLAPGDATIRLSLAYAYEQAGRHDAARLAFTQAVTADPANANAQLGLGYALWNAGAVAAAAAAFERAWTLDERNVAPARQLVYAYQRLGDNARARSFAERVLDGGTPPGAGTDDTATADERAESDFGLRRLHEDLGRRTTVTIDGLSGTRVGTGVGAAQPGSPFSSYSQIEASYRFGESPIRDGRSVAAYVRVLADGGDKRRALASENARVGLGLRWKPFGGQVLFVSAEYQSGMAHDFRDVLVRASAAFLNGGRRSDDWHPIGRGWFAQNLYLDAAHYLDARQSAFATDYRVSYHQKVASAATLEPFWHVQFNALAQGGIHRDVRTGLGVRWNLWYGTSRYDAPRHKLSLGIEMQRAVDTYLLDHQSLFATLSARW